MKNTDSDRLYNIALIPGDGIGREVVPEGVRVLEALAARFGFEVKFEEFPYGSKTLLTIYCLVLERPRGLGD